MRGPRRQVCMSCLERLWSVLEEWGPRETHGLDLNESLLTQVYWFLGNGPIHPMCGFFLGEQDGWRVR